MTIKKTYLVLLSLLLLALTLSSCGVPQEDYDALEAQLATVQNEYDAAKSDLAAAQSEVTKLQGDLTTQSAELAEVQDTNSNLQEQISELETRLNAILDTKVVEYYQFSFQFVHYDWTLSIPLRTYFYYTDKPRPDSFSGYSPMATEPYGDSLINILVRDVDDATFTNELTKMKIINLIATFVQTLPHTEDDTAVAFDGYPRYPIETLFDQGGDSEDTSILAAALLSKMGYDVVLLIFDEQEHMAVGVNIPNAVGSRWDYKGNKYFYLETTGKNWQLGDCPTEYRKGSPQIYPVGG